MAMGKPSGGDMRHRALVEHDFRLPEFKEILVDINIAMVNAQNLLFFLQMGLRRPRCFMGAKSRQKHFSQATIFIPVEINTVTIEMVGRSGVFISET